MLQVSRGTRRIPPRAKDTTDNAISQIRLTQIAGSRNDSSVRGARMIHEFTSETCLAYACFAFNDDQVSPLSDRPIALPEAPLVPLHGRRGDSTGRRYSYPVIGGAEESGVGSRAGEWLSMIA